MTQNAQHTPWRAQTMEGRYSGVSTHVTDATDTLVAIVYGSTEEERLLRARLVSAAPDYHEAADLFPDVHDGRMSNDELMEAVRDWYATHLQPAHAKAKATGQAA